ncbi:MAG: Gfo/Idh/MocA family oxidoreductase [Planctomycetes bacterium]|nr:Gfo/Idh/MocA family oxidoreductase [Planctomycetota bacterium]
MSTQNPLNILVVGCGNIAGGYGKTMKPYESLRIVGAYDVDKSRADSFCKEYGGKPHGDLKAALASPEVDAVLNLTIHHAHYEVIKQCLNAGKHVHSEKPLALNYKEAKELCDLADQKKLRLSSSPMTYMGEAQQTVWKAIRDGKLGKVRLVYCEVNWGRVEGWHPNPEPFFDVGALWDVGVYPLTLITTYFAPVRKVVAFGKVLYPDRKTKEGRAFKVTTNDWVSAALELADGTVARLTTSFYTGHNGKQKGLEFHGDKASVWLGSFQDFHAPVEFAEIEKPYAPLPYVRPPYQGVEWGRAMVELAEAIGENRPQRPTGRQAAHVVEVLEAISTSCREGRPVAVNSEFTPPTPMPWGK